MLAQHSLHLIFNFIGITASINQAHATSCQVYPSEYAYHDDSVNRAESASANCRRYPPDQTSEHHIHCNGKRLRLTDSNLGQEQYQSSEYYRWAAGSNAKLLFIFPTRVSLITITLHYYSDSLRGLSRLRFYAVPNDFDVWNAPTTFYPRVDVAAVPPGGEAAGHMNVNILNVTFDTEKVLLYKFSSTFEFAVSEVKFLNCTQTAEVTTTSTSVIDSSSISSTQTMSNTATASDDTEILDENTTNFSSVMIRPMYTPLSKTEAKILTEQSQTVTTAIGVSTAILLILSSALIITVVVLIWSYKRRSAKKELYTDNSYSTLTRESGQQIHSQSIQQDSAQLYDQIHLSPSTGQTEFIPKSESTNINNPSTTLQHSHPIYSKANDDRAKQPSALNAGNQVTTSQLPLQKAHESTCEQPTYAAVNKSKKKKFKKQTKEEDPKYTAAEKGPPVSPYRNELPSVSMQEKKEIAEKQEICPSHAVEELYTAVKKKPKGSEPKDEEETPPIPPHTVEEQYTAVEKEQQSNADESKDKAPSQRVLQNTTEDLYTAVMKKPKHGSTEAAPPLPPHRAEELYTAVVKKPKESTENKEEAPPIPPHTVEEN